MTLRTKQVLAIFLSTPIAVGTGVASSAALAGDGRMALFAGIGVLILVVIQILVGLHKTSDEQLLEIMKNADLAQRQRDAGEAAAIDNRIHQAIEAGDLPAVREWDEYRRGRPRR